MTAARPGVVLVAHGSPEPQSNDAFLALAAAVRSRRPAWSVRAGFLERARPDVLAELRDAVAAGEDPVALVPCFLFPGGHTDEDLPPLAAQARRDRPAADVRLGRPLGANASLADLLVDQVPVDALTDPQAKLLLVAAGSVAAANREAVERLTSEIRKRAGLGTRYGYLDQGEPLAAAALRALAREGARSVTVLPCLLFKGFYSRGLARVLEAFKMERTGVHLRVGEPLGADPRLAAVVEAEADALLRGTAPS